MFSFDYGIKACECSWFLIIALQAHTFWGVSHVFSAKFGAMTEAKNITEATKRIYDMIWAIAIIRFIGAILISILAFFTFTTYFCGYLL